MHTHSGMTVTAHTGGLHYLIGLCQLGELLLGFGIILIRVWVIFLGELREEMVNYYGHKMITKTEPQIPVTPHLLCSSCLRLYNQ